MRRRILLWIAAVLLSFLAGTAAAQDSRSGLRWQPARVPAPPRDFTLRAPQPAPAQRPAFRSANSSHIYHLGPLAFEKQRTAFLNQVRLPLTTFFGGRIELAGLHQRLRSINTHSAVPIGDAATSVYRVQSAGFITARTRSTWAGGLWLHFGRT